MSVINKTHDPAQMSWVESANLANADFPIQNLPFGVFRMPVNDGTTRVGVAIGNQILDVVRAWEFGMFSGLAATAAASCRSGTLNELMGLDRTCWSALREELWTILSSQSDARPVAARCLVPISQVSMVLPAEIRNFSDFSFSITHNQTMGTVAKREQPLHASFGYLPTGYHGRASSIVVSGTPCRRPKGQLGERTAKVPTFGPCRRLDYEMELSIYVGPGNRLGDPIALDDAEDHIFGVGLLNDWSARDIQSWETTPLGPFLGKSHMTSVSPWIVTLDALAPFRKAPAKLESDNRQLFDYLNSPKDRRSGAINITAEASISSQKMRDMGLPPEVTSRANVGEQYWTIFQLLAHQTVNGCNVLPGDILGSGTISSSGDKGRGCLQEKTVGGTLPFRLPSGEERTYLEDGDEVTLTACSEQQDFRRIGFGQCIGRIVPAHP